MEGDPKYVLYLVAEEEVYVSDWWHSVLASAGCPTLCQCTTIHSLILLFADVKLSRFLCIYVNFEIPACWLVQFSPSSTSMNTSFTNLFQIFLFLISVAVAQKYNTTNKEIPNNLSGNGCAPPWVQIYEIYDSCYLFSNQSGHWEKSKEYCSERNSYLVEIGSRQEQLSLAGESSFIHLQIRSASHKCFHFLRPLWTWMDVDRTEVRWIRMALGLFGNLNLPELHWLGNWATSEW